jgi:hypothetical protein
MVNGSKYSSLYLFGFSNFFIETGGLLRLLSRLMQTEAQCNK